MAQHSQVIVATRVDVARMPRGFLRSGLYRFSSMPFPQGPGNVSDRSNATNPPPQNRRQTIAAIGTMIQISTSGLSRCLGSGFSSMPRSVARQEGGLLVKGADRLATNPTTAIHNHDELAIWETTF